jgi:hypothetical protein
VDVFYNGTVVGQLDLEGRRIESNDERLKELVERYFAEGIPEFVPPEKPVAGLLGDGLIYIPMTAENLPFIVPGDSVVIGVFG